ncbi:hypothetical protein JXA32_04210 [Candidatus Sumerlaeota bacterium]|nr:hypothetical protein [Candidatus Sumerlaeota bacterium]
MSSFIAFAQTQSLEITISPDARGRTYLGLGSGCIFYQGHLVRGVPSGLREQTYDHLFSDIPMEYLMIWFRPNEEMNDNDDPSELNLDAFTHRRTNVDEYVEVINQARQRQPDIKLIATVYSPPAWLKTNKSIYGGGSLDTSVQNAYDEFGEFVFAYMLLFKEQGVAFDALMLTNEPDFELTHEDASYTPEQLRELHKRTVHHLRELIDGSQNTAGVTMPKIIAPSTIDLKKTNEYINALKADSEAWDNVDWISTHQYTNSTLDRFREIEQNIEGKPFIMSEWHSANNGDIDLPIIEVMEQTHAMITAFNGGVNSYWWFELGHPENTIAGVIHTPWGWPPEYGKTFHSWRQWANLTPVGSVRVDVALTGHTPRDWDCVAFEKDGVITFHLRNGGLKQPVRINVADQTIRSVEYWRTTAAYDYIQCPPVVPDDSAITLNIESLSFNTLIIRAD